jgi:hypothetical protein
MRALDIFYLIIFINLGMSFVNTLGIFDTQLNPATSQHINSSAGGAGVGYVIGTGTYDDDKTATDNMILEQKSIDSNPITGLFTATWFAFTFFITFASQALCIFPTLINDFHIPLPIAGILQTIIYIAYGVGAMQLFSGRSTNQME